MASLAQIRVRTVRGYAEAIDTLLATPQPQGTLRDMVAWDGNWVLDDPTSDEAAAAWLRDLAALIRSTLDETT